MESLETAVSIDFVPTICFVPRGMAKEKPEKVILTPEELRRIVKDTKNSLDEDNNDSDSTESNQSGDDDSLMHTDGDDVLNSTTDAYNFENYENEAVRVASINHVVDLAEQMPDENDSEDEDEIIKPSDNLLLVGRVQDDAASLEVWIFNEDEESLYTHHDFLLPTFPLCIEWLSHDPGSDRDGNLCAIGGMDRTITIWDLDIQDSLEPIIKLGSKDSKKKRFGHTDAVLDMSWNRHYQHILASGSVDQTLILWDLDECKAHTTINIFNEKVQSLQFHQVEAQTILTGCADKIVRLFDCRDTATLSTNFMKWELNQEVEKVLWNPNDNNYFVIGDNEGSIHYADCRMQNKILWTVKAHKEEISGLCFNSQVQNLLMTSSTEGNFKIWNFKSSDIQHVHSHEFKMGRIQCMAQCPEDPFTLAFGGEKPPHCQVYNIKNFDIVLKTFNLIE